MKRAGIAFGLCLLSWTAGAAAPENLYIWPDGAAQVARSGEPKEQDLRRGEQHFIRNITQASVDVWLPDPARADGSAMVVCPGGAFRFLTMSTEGEGIAQWLNARGSAAFVLHYRLKPTPRWNPLFIGKMLFELPPLLSGKAITSDPSSFMVYAPPAIADGEQALRFVRGQAARWHLDPHRIGIAGFSAGGVVALGASLTHDAQARPDYSAALYSGASAGTLPRSSGPL